MQRGSSLNQPGSAKKASSKPGISRSRRKRNEGEEHEPLRFHWLTMVIRAKAEGHLFRIGY